ncbi:hypothetical protein PoB_002306500 [Plakobranchus ocellatus]|uniref:Uncharacterized protein n=1 Tax=Plakobranchus ocellatus TaxID=259542 RepID=A0AAV3ZLM5_9GAST|nr:hypothetical protein PoB_002306500 [Plakobranchus ocellatus]
MTNIIFKQTANSLNPSSFKILYLNNCFLVHFRDEKDVLQNRVYPAQSVTQIIFANSNAVKIIETNFNITQIIVSDSNATEIIAKNSNFNSEIVHKREIQTKYILVFSVLGNKSRVNCNRIGPLSLSSYHLRLPMMQVHHKRRDIGASGCASQYQSPAFKIRFLASANYHRFPNSFYMAIFHLVTETDMSKRKYKNFLRKGEERVSKRHGFFFRKIRAHSTSPLFRIAPGC